MTSAISLPTLQPTANSVYNADNTPIYASGAWSLKNSSGVTGFSVNDAGAATIGPASLKGTGYHTMNGALAISGNNTAGMGASTLNLGCVVSTGVTQLTARGKDASTNGSYDIYTIRSDDSNAVLAMQISGAGAATIGPTGAADGTIIHRVKGRWAPSGDNTYNLGEVSNRWQAVYAVNGTIQISDFRLKENITSLGEMLPKVMQLKPSKWDSKFQDYKLASSGFVAQEVQQVFPELVHETQETVHGIENILTVSLGGAETTAILVKAIQEQQAIIESLKARIEALEA